jgi:NaMN:DMB phosphoribosyltransferase
MHIEEIIQKIQPADATCVQMAQARFDALIKPVGSLAQLEKMTAKYAGIVGEYHKLELGYPKGELLVWCGIDEAAQAEQIMRAEWPVNVLAAETNARTQALLVTSESVEDAMEEGAGHVQELVHENGLGLLGFGCLAEAGNKCVLAAMTGAILQAAALRVGVVLDGVATLMAAQKAAALAPKVLDYCFAGHVSTEAGAEELLKELGLVAPLRLDLPDGAGEGAALCFTLLHAGIKAYKEMETFEEAGVHDEFKEFSMAEQAKKEAKR